MGVSENGGFSPKSSIFNRVFHDFAPSILGEKSPYFWFNTHFCGTLCPSRSAAFSGFDATKITVFGAIAAIADRVARSTVRRHAQLGWTWWGCFQGTRTGVPLRVYYHGI